MSASGWAEVRKVLQVWFQAQWALVGEYSTVPIMYEGVSADISTAQSPVDSATTMPFIEMHIVESKTGSVQVELGAAPGNTVLTRKIGFLQFTISCPIGDDSGADQTSREIGDLLDLMFTMRKFVTQFGKIQFRTAAFATLGQVDNRFVAALTIPFYRDEFRTAPATVAL